MVFKQIRRHCTKIYSHKLFILILSFGFTIFLLDVTRMLQTTSGPTPDVLRLLAQVQEGRFPFQLRNLVANDEKYNAIDNLNNDNKNDNNINDKKILIDKCPMIDFFAKVDKTAYGYNPDIICSNADAQTDLICQIYLRQIGLDHLSGKLCKLDNPNRIPRVVYFVIFGTYTFKFWHYIAFSAAKRFIKPTAIYVIGDMHPMGRWWQQVLRDVHGVRFVYREIPTNISGQSVRFRHHLSDVVRLQTLYMNGGIYLDADMVVVRDLEPLLDHDITLGMVENGTGMGNAFIAAKRRSPFIQEWYSQYTSYQRENFYWNSLQVPRNMWFKNSSRVHMESERLYRPNWFESYLLYKRSDYPWRNNYAVHVWTNKNPVPKSPAEIHTANTTIAQIFRYAMYGDWRPRSGKAKNFW